MGDPDRACLELLGELTGVGYFQVDADRNVAALSPALEQLTGFTADEVLGRPCLTLIRCRECLQGCAVFKRGRVDDAPVAIYRKDGSEIDVFRSGVVLRDDGGEPVGALETVRLADERGVAGRSVPRELDLLLSGLGRMFIAADAAFLIRSCSPSLADVTGWGEEDLLGMPLEQLLGADLFGAEGMLRSAMAAGHRQEGWRAFLPTRQGGPLRVSLSVGPLADHDACGRDDIRFVVMIRPEEDGESVDGNPTFQGIVARSPAMQRIFRLIELLRYNDATVLITGESGTGKELIARAIHNTSHRAEGPFVAVNCAALPAELLESELFGHVRGSFTGAVRDRAGRFELADGGTLFLDEIGDLAPALQAKILRALQDRSFERIGDTRTRTVDVRVIAATHMNVARAVAEHRFREDLYYRLRVIPIEIPPLRQRREDLPVLIPHLLERIARSHHRALRLSPTASRVLLTYDWPGNVRELENALEYAVTVCDGQTIHVGDLPPDIHLSRVAASGTSSGVTDPAPSTLADLLSPAGGDLSTAVAGTLSPQEAAEAQRIRSALVESRYQRAAAARRLGMSRTTLWRKMKQYRL